MKTVRCMENEIPPMTQQRKAQWHALSGRADDAIDYSDIAPLDDTFWKNAVAWQDAARGDLCQPEKVVVTAKIDADVVAWLKRQGRDYQVRMNTILRHVMLQAR